MTHIESSDGLKKEASHKQREDEEDVHCSQLQDSLGLRVINVLPLINSIKGMLWFYCATSQKNQ